MIEDEYRRKIMAVVESGGNSFSAIREELRLESNQLSYHLNQLVKKRFLKKKDKGYFLTQQGKAVMPYIRYSWEYDLLPMVSVGVFVTKGDKVLLLKRKWEPFKDYYLGVSGKLKRSEDVFEAAKKRVNELVGISITNLKLVCINNFVSQSNHFVMFFFRATSTNKPDRGEWFNSKELPEKIFPETKLIIQKHLDNKSIKYISSYYNDKSSNFRVIN